MPGMKDAETKNRLSPLERRSIYFYLGYFHKAFWIAFWWWIYNEVENI